MYNNKIIIICANECEKTKKMRCMSAESVRLLCVFCFRQITPIFFYFLHFCLVAARVQYTSNVNRINGKSNEDTYSGLLIMLRDYDDNDEDEDMKFIQPLCQPSMGSCAKCMCLVGFFLSLHYDLSFHTHTWRLFPIDFTPLFFSSLFGSICQCFILFRFDCSPIWTSVNSYLFHMIFFLLLLCCLFTSYLPFV